jgi:hypothetical protein
MKTDKLLKKLEPLLPEKVRGWRRALDLVEPDVRALLEKQIFATAHDLLGDFRSKLLLSLPPKEGIKGDLHLGTVVYEEEKWPAGLQLSELLQNAAIFGRSGAGKTNATFYLLLQLAEKGIPFLFFDWKRTGRHLLPKLGEKTEVFTPGRKLAPFPFNPFIPPPGLEPRVYAQHVIDVLGDAYTLGDAARSILVKALHACQEEGNQSPTAEDLAKKIDALPNQERVRGWKATAARALESVANIDLAADGTTQAAMVRALVSQSTIIELEALSPSNRKFLLPLICQWIYYLKMPDSKREQLGLVIIIEEAHHLLYNRAANKETLMEQLLRQCREIGIGIVVVDQHPHLISPAALGNTYTSICLNLKDPKDSNKAAALSLMDDEKLHFSLLPVGHGVVKLQDRWRYPFLVKFPLVDIEKGAVTDEVLERLSQGKTTLSTLSARGKKEYATLGDSRLPDDILGRSGMALLNDVQHHADDGVQQRYTRLGVSADTGNKLKRQLISHGYLEEARVSTRRTRRVLLRLSKKAKELLGEEPIATRESVNHEYLKRWCAQRLERAGYKVWVEAPRNRGRVDVLATRANESVAIEVETGKSDAVWNVQQNLLSGFQRILVVATDTAARERVEIQLAKAGLLSPRVAVVLRDAVDDLE